MPPPAASKPARRESGFRAEPEQSNERAAIWWVAVITAGIVVGSVVCAVVAYAAGWFVLTRHDVITLEEFERLETGMTVEQCNQIVGEQGVESFSANSFGQSDRVFAWQNSGGTVVTAAFTNNRLHSKIQLGLK